MRLRLATACTGLVLLCITAGAIGASLERWAAYRSPLRVSSPSEPKRPTPRQLRLEALAGAQKERMRLALERQKLLDNLTPETMVTLGQEIVEGRGLCLNCHRVGRRGSGKQGPNLRDIGRIAATRVPGMSAADYLAQSLYEPDAYLVEGFAPSMTPASAPPIQLDETEVLLVVAYLESLGGVPTVTPETKFRNAP